MAGGPVCFFKGKELPCFICNSPKASITSQLIVKMLKQIDAAEVYNPSDGSLAFLLLNSHHSCVGLPFLKYINDDQHCWKVCIGVPYSTNLWQVHNAIELN
jgi:hypothetical protein